MKSVIVLGAGLIGKTIATDLSKLYDVTCADISIHSLKALSQKTGIKTLGLDFNDTDKFCSVIQPYDLVVCAVPGFMGFSTLKNIIGAGKNVVDISFFPEDPFELDSLAREKGITAIVDCGVAPGLCNVFAGYHHARMKLSRYECLVGGLPVKREWPFEYKAVFSPADVIEEYTRPARYIENGKLVIKDALSETEKISFDTIGELEAFNTDGLRTLAKTLAGVPYMKEKTLRYPGHAGLMKIFRETGLFSKEPVDVNGMKLSPLDLTSKLLFDQWKMKEGDEDYTIMRVTLEGDEGTFIYSLLDRFDKQSGTSSMARTTGYTCAAAAHLFLEGNFTQKGICPPEYLGKDEKCFDSIMSYLGERGVHIEKKFRAKKEFITA